VEYPVLRGHADFVVGVDIAKFAEERVAMAGEAEVAVLTRQRSSRDVSDR
jgi:hypothetical protein